METKMQLNVTTYVREAIRAGLAFRPKERVEIDLSLLTDNERTYLADTVTGCGDDIAYPHAIIPTPDNLVQSIREQAAKKEREEQAEISCAIRDAQDTLAKPVERSYRNSHRGKAWDAYENYPGMRERRAQCEAYNQEQHRKRREAEQEARDAREKQEEEKERLNTERVEKLRAWSTAHGSDLLRARIENSYAWKELAKKEFVQAHLLEGFTIDTDNHAAGNELETPSLEEMQACNAVIDRVADNDAYGSTYLVTNSNTRTDTITHSLIVEVRTPIGVAYTEKVLREFDADDAEDDE